MNRKSSLARAAIASVSTFVVIQGTIYYFYKITPLTIALVAIPTLAALYHFLKNEFNGGHFSKFAFPKIILDRNFILGTSFIIFDLALLVLFAAGRTTEALASPWQVIPVAALALFGLTTILLLHLAKNISGRISSVLLALHLLVAYGLAEAVYAYGFGFDPFIHRATEAHIAQFGFILPKKPFYNGQYVLVVALHWITRVSIDALDRWLVPVASALTLPWILREALERTWLKGSGNAAFWSIGIILFPMLPLTFTTPSNLTVLFLLYAVFLLPPAEEDKNDLLLLILVLAAGVVIHPLIGILAVCVAVVYWLGKKIKNIFIGAGLAFLLTAAAAPALLIANNLLASGQPLIAANPVSIFQALVNLLASPYAPFAGTTVNGWDLLYGYYFLMPALLAAGAAIGARELWKRGKKNQAVIFPAAALGTMAAAAFMSAAIYVPDVIAAEQGEFALRLVHAAGVILMPLFFIGADRLLRRFIKNDFAAGTVALFAVFSLAAAVSVYLSYPQYNERVQYAGFGVSRADFDAAKIIHDAAGQENYIVLSDQMLSVAALRVYGFENLPYAIPTGGELYQYYLTMAYYQSDRPTMEAAMRFAGVKRSFFAVSNYDPEYTALISITKPISDASWNIDDGQLAVFEFNLNK